MKSKKQLYMEYQPEENPRLHKAWSWTKRWWLPIAIVLITSVGLVCALSIPQKVFQTPANPDDKSASVLLAQSNLRLAFLYITGGAIAVLGLIETFRRNNNEKLKNDQEKEKHDKEHRRQVRAERRERYTKAVEQLTHKEAPARIGGIYTLVGLVTEWLEDENLSEYEKTREGQFIINNLCSYIRSPFALSSHYDELMQDKPTGRYQEKPDKFYSDKAILNAEKDVRLIIIKEIRDRLQKSTQGESGEWSNFEYNFSGSTFFYIVDFKGSYWNNLCNMKNCIYLENADFSGSTYTGILYRKNCTYKKKVSFESSIYNQPKLENSQEYYFLSFEGSVYEGTVTFKWSHYYVNVKFSSPESPSKYKNVADFTDSIYEKEVYLEYASYMSSASFYKSKYKSSTSFANSIYHDRADFFQSKYKSTVKYDHNIYIKSVDFSYSNYDYTPSFSTHYNEGSLFSHLHPSDFMVSKNSNSSILRPNESLPPNCRKISTKENTAYNYMRENSSLEELEKWLRELQSAQNSNDL